MRRGYCIDILDNEFPGHLVGDAVDQYPAGALAVGIAATDFVGSLEIHLKEVADRVGAGRESADCREEQRAGFHFHSAVGFRVSSA